jgi:hypothetical protein
MFAGMVGHMLATMLPDYAMFVVVSPPVGLITAWCFNGLLLHWRKLRPFDRFKIS